MKEKIDKTISILETDGRLKQTKDYIQHGKCSVYEHCVRVTKLSVSIAQKLKLNVEQESLIRGALLHDYFLYDWHDPDPSHSLHGFHHPKTALKRAKEDFDLTEIESDIILHHMFPLTLIPPKHKEAWIVCIADKISATQEISESVGEKMLLAMKELNFVK